MSTTQKPEALRLADKYEIEGFLQDRRFAKDHWCRQAAAELRRQHARIEDLEAQLSAIGAGGAIGVEPLRKQVSAPQAVHPKNIREGAPYDNPEFEQLARNMGVWGTPQAALCAQFWLAATQPTQQGLEQFIEQFEDVHFQRCRIGSKEGAIRWDIEFGHYGAEVRGKTLRDAITKAIAAQAKQGERP